MSVFHFIFAGLSQMQNVPQKFVTYPGLRNRRLQDLFFLLSVFQNCIQTMTPQKHLRERIWQAVVVNRGHRLLHIVFYPIMAKLKEPVPDLHNSIAGARVAIVGTPYAAGVDEPYSLKLPLERPVRVSADDYISFRHLRPILQAAFRSIGIDVFLVGSRTSVR